MKKKYYAVKKGNVPGIYETWKECQAQVSGFSGAVYKSFESEKEAELFLLEVVEENDNREYVDVYIDGSFDSKINFYSCGVVVLLNNEVITLSESSNIKDYVEMRNVAGELLGALISMQWAIKNQIHSINIHYDYAGIEKWAIGDWEAKKRGTKEYKKKFDEYKDKISIKFTKVKAHSGILYNEMADRLAKEALVKRYENLNDNLLDEVNYEILEKCKIVKKSNVTVIFYVRGHVLSQKQLVKYVKELWKKQGEKVKDINSIFVSVDCEKAIIEWNINNFKYKQRIKENI